MRILETNAMTSQDHKSTVSMVKVIADAFGESHFAEISTAFATVDFAPPAPPLGVCEPRPAESFFMIRIPVGWFGDWHPAPARQAMCFLSGEFSVEVSDGEMRRFGPGDLLLLDDLSGKGHRTRLLNRIPALIAVTRLSDGK
jgi:hypothetical protein